MISQDEAEERAMRRIESGLDWRCKCGAVPPSDTCEWCGNTRKEQERGVFQVTRRYSIMRNPKYRETV